MKQDIAATLNRLKLRTGAGNSWQTHRVQWARSHNGLPSYNPASADASMVTLEQAALRLHISESSVRKLINEKILLARQVVFGAPWQIAPESLALPAVSKAVVDIKNRRYLPHSRRAEGQTALFSDIRRDMQNEPRPFSPMKMTGALNVSAIGEFPNTGRGQMRRLVEVKLLKCLHPWKMRLRQAATA